MDIPNSLVLHAAPHPDVRVRQVGFTLDGPYLEHCWAPVLGPTSVLLLRRAAWMWRSGPTEAIPSEDLARGIGLGAGTGRSSALGRTVERLTHFGFLRRPEPGELEVFTEVPLLSARQLSTMPGWTRATHTHLVEQRRNQLERPQESTAPPPPHLERPLSRTRTGSTTGLGLT